jgi:hypothetical protein
MTAMHVWCVSGDVRGTTVVTKEVAGLFSLTAADFRETVKEYAAETLWETLMDCMHKVRVWPMIIIMDASAYCLYQGWFGM